ncbi:hypothetical protein A2Y85_05040 [candidate division WOR-3 bacterium RBG_13_43_14]|uniref:Secretion system C-terminal sorting domain-containing protein n=1 Tax=candidate division WOR-3 bacterium RBG_13_43_14 TaxID=1802590 RepID=A0A1F4UEH5_UNCW3|nr:MAG: hypothetical protein A2Y85_05040 [candidate division WOR-3 bacterium RBG_13_43_14]
MKLISYLFFTLMIIARLSADGTHKIELPSTPEPYNIVLQLEATEIAANNIREIFGEVNIGDPIICYDFHGNIAAYIFPFTCEYNVFSSEQTIFKEINDAYNSILPARENLAAVREQSLKGLVHSGIKLDTRQALEMCPQWDEADGIVRKLENQCWGVDRYGYLTISGRKDIAPILEYSNTLPYYYTYRAAARYLAEGNIPSGPARFSKFYYMGSMDQVFEFISEQAETVYVMTCPIRIVDPTVCRDKRITVTENEAKWIEDQWNNVRQRVRSRANHWIDGRNDVVPAYIWVAGCSPTSATMVLGYYDWYSPIGRWTNWGLLMPWYFERAVIKKFTDPNGYYYQHSGGTGQEGIPVSIYELAYRMGTDAQTGGTQVDSILDGILDWTNDNNWCGYSFSGSDYLTYSNWGQIWSIIQNQVNNNRPCMWSRDGYWSPGVSGPHSVAAIGYSDAGSVYYRSTWDLGWHADPYQGNGQTWAHTVSIIPCAGSSGNDIELFSPDGGETWPPGTYRDIIWYQFGGDIYDADLFYSLDSGYNRTPIAYYVRSYEGWNYYSWLIPNGSYADVFVSIEAYDYSGWLTAAEGSENRFTIGQTAISDDIVDHRIHRVSLQQNYPNPVSTATTICFSLTRASNIQLNLYDVVGKKIVTLKEGKHGAGTYKVHFDADHYSLSNGMYFYALNLDGHNVALRKLIVCR